MSTYKYLDYAGLQKFTERILDRSQIAYAEYLGTSISAAVTTKYGHFPTTLVEGARVSIKFEGSISYITSLNVNNTGAKSVYYKGRALTSGMINQHNTYDFVYDGSYWCIIGVDTDTHHTAKNIVGASATANANATATNGNVYLNLIENSTVRSKHNIKGTNGVEVTSDASGNITISGSGSGNGDSDIYTLTSFTKSQLDSFTSGSSISISSDDFNVISSNTKIICINNGGLGGKCIMVGWNVQSSSVAQLTFLCDNILYICKVAINTSSSTGTIGEVSKHLVGVDENTSTLPFYITEFTLDDLRSSSSSQEYYSCDAAAVCAALDEGKIILVPIFDGAVGYVVAKVYYEDLLYWTIYDESLLQVFTFEMGVTQTDIESTSVTTSILATQSYVDNAVSNVGGSYVPMPETFIEQGASIDHTLLPNSSVFALLSGSGAVRIYLQQPTSFDVVNEYTMIFHTFGFGNAITLDKTIIWANDNPPVLDDSVAEILEISVKCVNASMYGGIQYLGTWAKYSV